MEFAGRVEPRSFEVSIKLLALCTVAAARPNFRTLYDIYCSGSPFLKDRENVKKVSETVVLTYVLSKVANLATSRSAAAAIYAGEREVTTT